jgi:hypothetical protein
MTALLVFVTPVKNALGKNVIISSVPANKGIQGAVEVTTVAAELAAAAVVPTPKKAVTAPALRIRYWLPPKVVETACTAVGAVVAAVNVTVLPDGVKGALTAMLCP